MALGLAVALDQGWVRVRLRERLLLWAFLPLTAIYVAFLTRERLARELGDVDDLPTRDDVYTATALPGLRDLIETRRDPRLLEAIRERCAEPAADSRTIGVLYGARHMSAVVQLLVGELGYHVASAEWITVFAW